VSEVFVAGVAAIDSSARSSIAAVARATARAALSDAGVDAQCVTAVFVGSGGNGLAPSPEAVAVRLGLRALGFRPPSTGIGPDAARGRVEHVSASAVEALHQACGAVELGSDDLVLCIGTEQTKSSSWPPPAALTARALAARRYLNGSGASIEDLARVVAKNHRHGAARGMARELAVQEILAGDVLEWPLTREMVAARGLGAAALVLASRAGLGASTRAGARVRASVLVSADEENGSEPAGRAARLAYREAALGPEDVDLAELHDVTPAAELAAYEQLGLVADGRSGELVQSGFTALGGVLPVNPSGGLLCLGERPGTSAITQIAELTRQLRGQAGAVQVSGAAAALAQCLGRPEHGMPAVLGLTILTT
jgi:acetyl-CoA acyltransferase